MCDKRKLKTEDEVRLRSGRDLVSKRNCPAGRHRTVSIEERAHTAASATDRPLPRFGMSRIGLGHLLAVAILIGPNRSTTIGLPLASLPCTP